MVRGPSLGVLMMAKFGQKKTAKEQRARSGTQRSGWSGAGHPWDGSWLEKHKDGTSWEEDDRDQRPHWKSYGIEADGWRTSTNDSHVKDDAGGITKAKEWTTWATGDSEKKQQQSWQDRTWLTMETRGYETHGEEGDGNGSGPLTAERTAALEDEDWWERRWKKVMRSRRLWRVLLGLMRRR